MHSYVQRENGIIFAIIHSYLGRKTARPSTCAKTPKICRSPYRDTVENGSTLGKSSIHDPQLDPKVLKLTPNFWNFDPLRKARSDRLCRAL